MHKKSFLAYAGIAAVLAVTTATPGFGRQAQKTTNMASYQSASASFASAPLAMSGHPGQCWIATDANRPYGYLGSCANPLARDPALDPTYDGTLHGE